MFDKIILASLITLRGSIMSDTNLNLEQENDKILYKKNKSILENHEIADFSCWEYEFISDVIHITNFPDDSASNFDFVGLNNLLDNFHEVDKEAFSKELDKVISEGLTYLSTNFRINRNNKFEWINIRAKIKYDANGKPVKAQGIMGNINEERLIADRYFQSQKMEAIERLSGRVAHDFNSMLQTIIGYGELIENNIETSGKNVTYIAKLLESAKRSENIVKQLFGFSGKQNMKLELLDINAFMAHLVIRLNDSIGKSSSISFDSSLSSNLILADKSQLEQIIVNLCNNSFEAMKNSGTITITLDKIDFHSLNKLNVLPVVHKHMASEYVKISVSDSGCGILPEDYNKIFDPYYSTKVAGIGTGFGLSLVYTIVEAHSGYIDVSSVIGVGTQLDIYLPISDTISASDKPSASILTDDEDKVEFKTILIVEEEPSLRDLVEKLLSSVGYEVVVATSVSQALDIFSLTCKNVDLLITNIDIPDLSNNDLYSIVRKIKPDLPIILCSAYSISLIENHSIRSNCMFLQKPYSKQQLLNAIEKISNMINQYKS